ncbi:retinoblastoma-like protein 2 isoform X1 [Microplitis demolitor]|uniref:retinoblastoma-like protein 2 isoform X1 n=1 Tax=Microplitis demolitor TaxID=69319 RepID=UPI0004CD67E4|nr:retinoblastoma-like protein 2 isoform X1 [Microplitis demolitor]
MGQSDDLEDYTYSRHQDLCQKLNMDASAASEAWKSYSTIRQNYTLEGEQMHWIGCAVYVACRESSTPTVGKTGPNVEGNCVSLTRLLKLCNLSLIQFFSKCKSWADMANMPQSFRSKIDKIERDFAVSMVIFKKYQPIFTFIFRNPVEDPSKPQRSRRHKSLPCTPSKVFEFCWVLFICVKGAFPDISDDLVNSYHLLLVCCDLVYSNALLAGRKDLLNPNFPGLPHNFNDDNFEIPKTANCIVSLLCERHEAIAVEAKVIKEYSFKSHINKLINEKILRGEQSNFSGILEASNFEANHKSLNKAYEQHVLNMGDFDERIFLAEWRRVKLKGISSSKIVGDYDIISRANFVRNNNFEGADASDNIGSPTKMLNIDLQEQFQLKRDQIRDLAPPTPLTGRKYLKNKDMPNITPVSTATQSVIRLQALLAGRQAAPNEVLLEMYKSCSTDVKSFVEIKIKENSDKFYVSYTQNVEDVEAYNLDFGKKRLILGQTLFYKILEIILSEEKKIKPDYDITNLLLNDVFLQCLFACCLEIVIWSYKNTDRIFPWILNALNVEPYNFYKVIEVIVRAEQLSRDVVKHLNDIEEKILETQAWKSNSPLWQAIENTPGGVPSCEEVSLPGMLDSLDSNTSGQPVLRKVALDRGAPHHDNQQSPISSASERFQSPVTASGMVKKRLFNDPSRGSGQSILKDKCPQKIIIDGNSRVYVIPDSSQIKSSNLTPTNVNRESNKSRKTGSVALFFRKFYILGSIRMQNLCNSLSVTDVDLKKKIWTIFEYSIKDRTELMKDRHLDQILMCAVYVVCKLAKIERNTFTEIMRCYRLQPQAESHIYRSVLISKNPSVEKNFNKNDTNADSDPMEVKTHNATPPTPSNMAGTSQSFGDECRGDLIKFYNTIYVPQVKEVANLSRGNNSTLTLSPLPKSNPAINSPVRRVSNSVMTRTLDPRAITASPAPQLSYCFSRSPAKDLEAINRMMISLEARKSVGKRLLSDEMDVDSTKESLSPTKKTLTTPCLAKKIENLIGERRTQNQ